MAGFSMERALGAGFGVIQRKPQALLAWAGVYLVVYLLPSFLLWSQMAPRMMDQVGRARPDPQAALGMVTTMLTWAPLLWLLGLVVLTLLYGAVFRAVLMPGDDRYLYLRLSMRELWLGLTTLSLAILFVVGFGLAGFAVPRIAQTAPWFVTTLAVVGIIGVAIWLLLRLSLSTAIAFAEQRFALFDSWRLTEGHAWKLFGVAVGLVAIVLLVEMALFIPIVVVAVVTGVVAGVAGAVGGGAMRGVPGFTLPWMVLGGAVLSLFGAVVYTLLAAPWARIYQELSGEAPPERPAHSPGEAVPLN